MSLAWFPRMSCGPCAARTPGNRSDGFRLVSPPDRPAPARDPSQEDHGTRMTTPDPPYEGAQADIAELIDELERLVSESRRVPFSRNVLVEEGRFLDLVELLRETVPDEIRQAQRVVRERERILGEAQAEATKIVATARQRGEYWASEEGILNEARQRSEELLRRSDEERRRSVGEIEMFAYQRLTEFETAIRQGFHIIEDAMEDAVARLDEAIEQARGDDDRPV